MENKFPPSPHTLHAQIILLIQEYRIKFQKWEIELIKLSFNKRRPKKLLRYGSNPKFEV